MVLTKNIRDTKKFELYNFVKASNSCHHLRGKNSLALEQDSLFYNSNYFKRMYVITNNVLLSKINIIEAYVC